MDAVFGLFDSKVGNVFNVISDLIVTSLGHLLGTVMYYITSALMFIVGLLQQLFDVFSGATKVQYAGEYNYLTDVFFKNEKVAGVYWAMALLGITLVILFTIIAVVRKSFDLGDKMQNRSMGALLGSMFKSILIMLLLSFFLDAGLSISNMVINRVGYIFANSESFSRQQEIHFTDEQFAAMGRVYTTIGNFSLNESYDSRYNLNKCFNEVRGDLNYLERQGVFDFVYDTDESGKEKEYWQSTLQKLVYAANTSQDVPMDKYNEELSEAMLEIMEELRENPKFYPVKDYQNKYVSVGNVSLDRVLFLSGTSTAANNEKFNEDPYLLDGLRGAFYTGEKSIYSMSDVKDAFNICLGGIKYIFIWILAYFTIRNLLRCIFGCIMRIFNMVSLYLVAPLVIAPMPMDDGEKFKQWTMSMIIQVLGILGSIIPMRLIILFAPLIMSPDLVLFDSVVLNFVGKVLMIVGGLEAVESFGGMITGILANNAGMAAINAGNQANALGDKAFGVGKTAVGVGAKIAGRVAGTGLKAVGSITGLNYVGNKIGEGISKISGLGNYMDEHGGALFSAIHALRGGDSDDKDEGNDSKGGGGSQTPQSPQQKAVDKVRAQQTNQSSPVNLANSSAEQKNNDNGTGSKSDASPVQKAMGISNAEQKDGSKKEQQNQSNVANNSRLSQNVKPPKRPPIPKNVTQQKNLNKKQNDDS